MQYRIRVRISCLDMVPQEWMRRLKAEYQEGQAGTELGFVLTWEIGDVAVFTFPPMSYSPNVVLVSEKAVRARQFAGHHRVNVLDVKVMRTEGVEFPKTALIPLSPYTQPGVTIH